jgi:hypothetical protein
MKAMANCHPSIEELIKQAKSIVAWFHGPHFQTALFREKSPTKGLIGGCETRYGLYFLMFFRLEEVRDALTSCVCSDAYVKKGLRDDLVKPIIMDSEFWSTIKALNEMMWPSLLLLRGSDGVQPTLSKVVARAHEARARLEMLVAGTQRPFAPALLTTFDLWMPKMMYDVGCCKGCVCLRSVLLAIR